MVGEAEEVRRRWGTPAAGGAVALPTAASGETRERLRAFCERRESVSFFFGCMAEFRRRLELVVENFVKCLL